MNAEGRLEALVRAYVDHEVRDVRPAPDLAARVIAAGGARRRTVRWRLGLPLAAAGAVAAASMTAVALVDRGPDPRPGPGPVQVRVAAFDANRNVKIAYQPAGAVPVTAAFVPVGWARQCTDCPLEESRTQRWRRDYQIQGPGAERGRGQMRPRASVSVAAGPTSLDRWLSEPGSGPWQPFQVPPSGKAVQKTERLRGATIKVINWEPRAGVIITVRTVALPMEEADKILQGITVSE